MWVRTGGRSFVPLTAPLYAGVVTRSVTGVGAAALLALVGCGSNRSPSLEAAADPEAFCRQLIPLVADRETCANGSRRNFEAGLDAERTCPAIAATVAAGGATYDRGKATACLNWLQARSCEQNAHLLSAGGPCREAVVGGVAEGGACHELLVLPYLSDCAPGAFCRLDATCPGTCQAYGKDGGSCDRGHPCAPALTCDSGTCKPLAAGGATCTQPSQLVYLPRIDVVYTCEEPFVCTGSPATCGHGLSTGAACRPGVDICETGRCTTAGKCYAFPAPGEACVEFSLDTPPGDDLPCADYVRCVNGRCVEMPGEGQPCTADLPCGPGLQCDANGTCAKGPPEQQPFRCLPGARCGHTGERCCSVLIIGSALGSTGCEAGAACGADGMCP